MTHKYPDYFFHGEYSARARRPDPPPPKPGDRVRFHGLFLKNTGQMTGEAGRKVWMVEHCACPPCAEGRWVAVNEIHDDGRGNTSLRHIAAGNLGIVGRLDIRDSP